MSKANKPKIGAGHVTAMLRQGLRELRATVFPESNVAQQPELGIWGTKTPQEITSERRADAMPEPARPAKPEKNSKAMKNERTEKSREVERG